MNTVVIPADAQVIRCPRCGTVLHNLQKLGVRHQVGCRCGAKVIVDRRGTERTLSAKGEGRRRG